MAHYVITGASSGIGLEFARVLQARGDKVTAICRRKTPELEATGAVVIDGMELTRGDAVARIKAKLTGQKIDVLIHNAGLLKADGLRDISLDSVKEQFEINTFAPLAITSALLDYMADDSKIALITSRMGSMADNSSGAYYGYRASKAALNAVGVSMACDLKPLGIWVGLLHPGFVKTKMTGMNGDISVEQSVSGLLKIIDEAKLEETGTFGIQMVVDYLGRLGLFFLLASWSFSTPVFFINGL